jgi:hypothetical protein
MTPNEKAEELVNKYLLSTPIPFHIDDAKICALIAVDEMLPICSKTKIIYSNTTIHPKLNYTELTHYTEDFYWKQVRNEIEKL